MLQTIERPPTHPHPIYTRYSTIHYIDIHVCMREISWNVRKKSFTSKNLFQFRGFNLKNIRDNIMKNKGRGKSELTRLNFQSLSPVDTKNGKENTMQR
jgi:hypothetical protein